MDGLLRLQKPTNGVSRVRARRVSPKILACSGVTSCNAMAWNTLPS